MAQYQTQIVNQSELGEENLQNATLLESATNVQYVIKTDDQQQNIIVSGDQFMVLDNLNSQQVITIQNPQFQAQPIYYMDTGDSLQPVLLNTALQQKALVAAQNQQPAAPIKQIVGINRPDMSQQRPGLVPYNRARAALPNQQMNRSFPQVGGNPPRFAQRGIARQPRAPMRSVNQFRQFLEPRSKKPPVPRNAQQPQMVRNNQQQQFLRAKNQQNVPNQMQSVAASVSAMPIRKAGRILQPNPSGKLPAVLRNFEPPPEIRNIISRTIDDKEFQNSIRMFVLMSDGEQRLITFTTPKEDCTIQEILEQVGVNIHPGTNVAMKETNGEDGINLIVSVGFENEEIKRQNRPTIKMPEARRAQTPELEPDTRRLIPGKLALCPHCGVLSEAFNRCDRCGRQLPVNVKIVEGSTGVEGLKQKTMRSTIAINLKSHSPNAKMSPVKRKIIAKVPQRPLVEHHEPLVVTLSSDEEVETEESQEQAAVAQKNKEPTLEDFKIQSNSSNCGKGGDGQNACTTITCRTIRIGSYRFTPKDDVIVNNSEIILKVPHPKEAAKMVTLSIPKSSCVKVLVNFHKILPVIFYYIIPAAAKVIRDSLGMVEGTVPYFDPLSSEEADRRITLLPEFIGEEDKWVFDKIYVNPAIMEELNPKEANVILIKTCPKDQKKAISNFTANVGSDEVKQLLIYPPGKGGIPINSEDYKCLAQDQFLNDVIIDFYLKYFVHQLPKQLQEKVHVFSTFFYNRLTTKPARRLQPLETETLSPAERRHARVKNWTKQVNIFEKDFIIVPINEHAHWFLAVICFPHLPGPQTFDGKPCEASSAVLVAPKKPKTTTSVVQVADAESDKDEAEGDDNELESDDSDDSEPAAPKPEATAEEKKVKSAIKQPCILIFDSLVGLSRARVVATLRDYLTCEYKAKHNKEKVFTKDNIRGTCPKVPQQTNYTDCGLYVLQFAEALFENPISDYCLPIKSLRNWFDKMEVTRKREDVANIIKELMEEYKKDVSVLPEIQLPTENGVLIERTSEEEETEMEVASQNTTGTEDSNTEGAETEAMQTSDSPEKKPLSDRDMMSYLKSKRIIKNKAPNAANNVEVKKIKLSVSNS